MPFITILFALDFIITGIVGFVVTGKEHITALIPAFIGILMLVLGVLAFNPKLRKHVMHGAALVAVLGFLGTISGLTDLPKFLSGNLDAIQRPAASVSKLITNLLMLHFVVICVISFIEARLARKNS